MTMDQIAKAIGSSSSTVYRYLRVSDRVHSEVQHETTRQVSAESDHEDLWPRFSGPRAACRVRTDDLSLTRRLLWPTELRRQRIEVTGRVEAANGVEPRWPVGTNYQADYLRKRNQPEERHMSRLHKPKAGFWIRTWVAILYPIDGLLFRIKWRNLERIPAPDQGGVLIAINHVSQIDTVLMARLVWQSGRVPRFMIKAGVFGWPIVGGMMKGAGQIAVYRGTSDAVAVAARRRHRARARRGGRHLSRGDDHQGPGQLADAGQDRHRPAGAALPRHPGGAGRPVGAAPDGRLQPQAIGPPAAVVGLGRRTAGHEPLPRQGTDRRDPARDHRRDHGRGARPRSPSCAASRRRRSSSSRRRATSTSAEHYARQP